MESIYVPLGPEARRAKHIQSKNLVIAIWQPCLVLVALRVPRVAPEVEGPRLNAVRFGL